MYLPFFEISVPISLSISLIFWKNQLLIILFLYWFLLILLTSTLIFIIPFLLLTLGSICCWRRPSRGHNHWLTLMLDPGYWRLLITSPVLGMCILPTVPTWEPFSSRSLESNVLLRPSGPCTWLDPVKVSKNTFKILTGGHGDLLVLQLPPDKSSM